MTDPIDLDRLAAKVTADFAGGLSAVLVRIGEQTGLFRALAEGPTTSIGLAARAGCAERYVREWLAAMAASGYVAYQPSVAVFSLSPAQAAVFAREGTSAYMPPLADVLMSVYQDEPKITAAFRSGDGVPWGDHHACLFCGNERFFRPKAEAFLLQEWLPALDGVVEILSRGGKVADIGCGRGASTLLMARAFPRAAVVGFDLHRPSVEAAAAKARSEGLANLAFEVAPAQAFPGEGFDLVTIFDALHDMGDPVGAARHVRRRLAPDGVWMVVEPLAGDALEDNLNLLGQLFYGCSTVACTPAALSQDGGYALGAQAGEARLTAVLNAGGFSRVRRVAQTASNMVLEARP